MPGVATPRAETPSIVLENIRWSTYEALLADRGPARGKRFFYDRGTLEIMTTSPWHERVKKTLARIIETLTLELGIPIVSLGQTTWKLEVLQKGCEADECYYVQSVPRIRDVKTVSVERDPPPDVAVEADITSSSVDKQAIYAAFGVPEIWRYDEDEERVAFLALGSEGKYREVERSLAFPFLEAADLNRFLAMARSTTDETAILRRFRDWVLERHRDR